MYFHMKFTSLLAAIGTLCFTLPNFAWSEESVPGEFIVTYKASSRVSSKTSSSKSAFNHNLSVKKSWSKLRTYHYKSRYLGDDEQIMEDLRNDPSVLSVEPNYILKALSFDTTPSTTDNINIDEAWVSVDDSQEAFTGRGGESFSPIVAVIDSGLDVNHEVFDGTGKLWENTAEVNGELGVDDDGNGYVDDYNGWNFVNDSNDVFDDDEVGHGSHVAGIVASSVGPIGSDGGYSSLPAVRVMVLKFLNGQGEGTTSDAIDAIEYAIANGAKVLNNSWGGSNYSVALHRAVIQSYESDTVFVAASGNEGLDIDSLPLYPAALDVPNVVSVGASQAGTRAYFSNFGTENVHISAPGVNIYSTWPGNDYGRLSGTSMAAPYVSALSALMTIEAPHFSGYQIKRDLISSGRSFVQLNGASSSGKRIDYEAAVMETQARSGEVNFKPEYSPDFSSRSIASTDAASSNGGSGCASVKDISKSNGSIDKTKFSVLFLMLLPLMCLTFVRIKKA